MLSALISQQPYEVDVETEAQSVIVFKEMSKLLTRVLQAFHDLPLPIFPASCPADLLSPAFYSHSSRLSSGAASSRKFSFTIILSTSWQGYVPCPCILTISLSRVSSFGTVIVHSVSAASERLWVSKCGDLGFFFFFLFNPSIQPSTGHITATQ